jgi:hypothetical protein
MVLLIQLFSLVHIAENLQSAKPCFYQDPLLGVIACLALLYVFVACPSASETLTIFIISALSAKKKSASLDIILLNEFSLMFYV